MLFLNKGMLLPNKGSLFQLNAAIRFINAWRQSEGFGLTVRPYGLTIRKDGRMEQFQLYKFYNSI